MDFVYALWESSERQVTYNCHGFPSNAIRLPSGLVMPTESIKYVGITDNPIERRRAHIASKDEKKNPGVVMWIKQLKRNQVALNLEILEKLETREEAEQWEFYWINFCISQGAVLFNRYKVDSEVVAAARRGGCSATELALLVAERTAFRYDLWLRCQGAMCGTSD